MVKKKDMFFNHNFRSPSSSDMERLVLIFFVKSVARFSLFFSFFCSLVLAQVICFTSFGRVNLLAQQRTEIKKSFLLSL